MNNYEGHGKTIESPPIYLSCYIQHSTTIPVKFGQWKICEVQLTLILFIANYIILA